MIRNRAAMIAASVLIAAMAGTTASCSAPDGGTPPPSPVSPAASVQAMGPVIVDPESLDGSTVTVPLGRMVVLYVQAESVTEWSSTVSDPAVAQFVAGYSDETATYSPGWQSVAEGTTTVTVVDDSSGMEYTFTLEVTAGS